MRQRSSSLPLLVVVAVVALVLGSIGTAVAGPVLTKAKVKRIAAKVVKKKAPKLSVANANKLGGQPPTAYQDNVTVYTVAVPSGAKSRTIGIPLAPGNYQISYSAYLLGGSDYSYCAVVRHRGGADFFTADDTANTSQPSFSGVGVLDVVAGDTVRLSCESTTTWATSSLEPIQIVVTPLDSVTNGTLTAVKDTAARDG
jgi:hypothetical protein